MDLGFKRQRSGNTLTRVLKAAVNLFYILVFTAAMFVLQRLFSQLSGAAASSLSYRSIDPNGVFAELSVHHIIQSLPALAILIAIKLIFKKDIGFKPGRVKTGMIYIAVFTVLAAAFQFITYSLRPPRFAFPLNAHNVLGSLSFQAFLSGPSEEILFRALPIILFIIVFRRSVNIKFGITLETLIAALIFSVAHMQIYSLFPLIVTMDYIQVIYAFIVGVLFGVVYQKSESIIYPMVMHSMSNVLAVGIGYLIASS